MKEIVDITLQMLSVERGSPRLPIFSPNYNVNYLLTFPKEARFKIIYDGLIELRNGFLSKQYFFIDRSTVEMDDIAGILSYLSGIIESFRLHHARAGHIWLGPEFNDIEILPSYILTIVDNEKESKLCYEALINEALPEALLVCRKRMGVLRNITQRGIVSDIKVVEELLSVYIEALKGASTEYLTGVFSE